MFPDLQNRSPFYEYYAIIYFSGFIPLSLISDVLKLEDYVFVNHMAHVQMMGYG